MIHKQTFTHSANNSINNWNVIYCGRDKCLSDVGVDSSPSSPLESAPKCAWDNRVVSEKKPHEEGQAGLRFRWCFCEDVSSSPSHPVPYLYGQNKHSVFIHTWIIPAEFSQIHRTWVTPTFLDRNVYGDGGPHSQHAIHRQDASQLLFLGDGVTNLPPTCITRVGRVWRNASLAFL